MLIWGILRRKVTQVARWFESKNSVIYVKLPCKQILGALIGDKSLRLNSFNCLSRTEGVYSCIHVTTYAWNAIYHYHSRVFIHVFTVATCYKGFWIPSKLSRVCETTSLHFPPWKGWERILFHFRALIMHQMPRATKGTLSSCPMLKSMPDSKPTWMSLVYSMKKRNAKISVMQRPK